MNVLNHRTVVVHPDCKQWEEFILSIPERFRNHEGTVIQ